LIIAAPLFEEAFFRGFLLKGLESSFMGPIGAVVVTAGLWALIHVQYDAFGMATIFCLGLLLGTARVFTGSLLVPLGLHAFTNLGATIEAAIQA
jgi:CAAX protease family protein